MTTYEEQKDKQQKYRDRRKERIIRVMGGSCALCGYCKCADALELHHIDPEQKEFGISARVDISWARTAEELKKCVLLCANCHREYHANEESFELKTSFNQEICDEVTLEVEATKRGVEGRCCDCGCVIDKTATRCIPCAARQRRRVEDRPTGYELAQLIAELGFSGVGRKFGVTDNAVRKWCKTENLPTHKADIVSYVNKRKEE